MIKWVIILTTLSLCITTPWFAFNDKPVKVILVHRNDYAPIIVVDALPWFSQAKIAWWEKYGGEILKKYNLDTDEPLDSMLFFIYEYGEGFQELGKEDRFCFPQLPPPKNCLDKNIPMLISYLRNGGVRFGIDEESFIRYYDSFIYE